MTEDELRSFWISYGNYTADMWNSIKDKTIIVYKGDQEELRDLRMLLASARNIAEIQQRYSGFDYKSVIRDLKELEDKIENELTK